MKLMPSILRKFESGSALVGAAEAGTTFWNDGAIAAGLPGSVRPSTFCTGITFWGIATGVPGSKPAGMSEPQLPLAQFAFGAA